GPKAPDEKDWLKLFDGGEPILILFDEMPPYFHYPDTQKVGNGTVADIATRAFANLLTAAGKKSNVCVVVSDLAATYDTGTRLINRALEDALESWASGATAGSYQTLRSGSPDRGHAESRVSRYPGRTGLPGNFPPPERQGRYLRGPARYHRR